MKDYLMGLLISIAAIFAPVGPLIGVSFILILSDLITGLLASRKLKEPIDSAGMGRTFSKILVCASGICLCFLVEKFIIEEWLPLSKLAAGAFTMKELKSILENLDILNGSSVFKTLIKKLGSVNDLDKAIEEQPKVEEKKDGESL